MLATISCSDASDAVEIDAIAVSESASGCVVTLHAHDELENTYNFERSCFGKMVEGGQIRNAGTQIKYSRNQPAKLIVAGTGGEFGGSRDLGTLRNPETLKSNFWSLEVDGDDLYVRDGNARQSMGAVPKIVNEPTHLMEVALGNAYVLHLKKEATQGAGDENDDPGSGVIVLMLITDFVPGVKVTFRWRRLV